MSRLLDDEPDELPQPERELTLSTGAILAIFLGLVLLCGVFFGFGYNLGRKSTTASNGALPSTTNETETENTGSSAFDNFKPSPGSPNTRSSAASSAATAAPGNENARVAVKDSGAEALPTRSAAGTAYHPVIAPSTSAPARPAIPAAPAISPNGAFVVQIAAISATHKDDADLLANALRGRGYTVAERTDSQDKLIHVQVGPFATKADAETMRQRLVVDGYNPIIK